MAHRTDLLVLVGGGQTLVPLIRVGYGFEHKARGVGESQSSVALHLCSSPVLLRLWMLEPWKEEGMRLGRNLSRRSWEKKVDFCVFGGPRKDVNLENVNARKGRT